ncbi:lysophospholipid acyltransferase family protein [Acaryochloris sp. IP29b_bin.148]|uniref:lysophospholipid acyltransferase family protein n=1 Tax=Acaryochloris sp. IP29b_bin.148 TaxID=2969218 RepID=UPI002606115B|nr:lysophospholipid acyltransferase family protein [Acaryochloris sp. IP29b_bin.148]
MKSSVAPKPRQGWSLEDRDPAVIAAVMPRWQWFYDYYFRVQTSGWHHVPSEKALFVGTHNGGLAAPDLHMLMYDWFYRFGAERPIYGLMHKSMWRVSPRVAEFATLAGAIRAYPTMAKAAFQRGASVAVFPGGAQDVFRPHRLRDRIYFCDRKGFIKLALQEAVPIVPFISWGAHDTLLVLADGYEFIKQLHDLGLPWLFDTDPTVFPIYLGLPWGLSLGPLPNLPLPSQIHTQICPPIHFEHYGRQAAKDRTYVQDCYDQVVSKMQFALDQLILEANGT